MWDADVAGAALRILLRGAEGLAPNMVAGVLARCARCGLDADLRAFAIAAALTHKAPPEIAAVAAVVQADPRLMESVLSASGGPFCHPCCVFQHVSAHADWGLRALCRLCTYATRSEFMPAYATLGPNSRLVVGHWLHKTCSHLNLKPRANLALSDKVFHGSNGGCLLFLAF